MKSSLLIFILLMQLGAAQVAAKSYPVERRSYAMPVAETEDVISTWLETSGFRIQRQSSVRQHVTLVAEKPHVFWRITLKPDSPLATLIQLHIEQGRDISQIKDFWQALDGYIQISVDRPAYLDTPIPQEVRKFLDAVVCIYANHNGRELQFSGFIVDTHGLIVCTAHDLRSLQQVSVRLQNGRRVGGRVVKIDTWRDLSLVRVNTALKKAISLRTGRYLLQNGDSLYAINCSDSGVTSIQTGFLDGPPRRVGGVTLWQAQLHVDPGSSGSPVFDAQGRLSAIVKGRYRGTDSVGFLIPFETLLHFLEKY